MLNHSSLFDYDEVRSIMLKQMIKKLLNKKVGGVTVDFLRKHGAVVGDNVKLYCFECNKKDATCLEIGNNVTLTGVQVLTHDASLELFTKEKATKVGRVVIGNNVFVGIHSIILPNVHIGSNVIIGAGSVVSSDIPDDSVVVGNPAKVIDSVSAYISKHQSRMCADNIFVNLARDKMGPEEIRDFNKKIDGRIVYLIDD